MAITILQNLSVRIAGAESAMGPIDEFDLAAELVVLAGPAKDMPADVRAGCVAEIEGLRFMAGGASGGGPWGIYFRPQSSAVTKDGKEIFNPDARYIEPEVIAYWASRSAVSHHPTLRARYADLAIELGSFRNRNHPDEPRIPLPHALRHCAIDAYLDAVERGLTTDARQAWRFLARAIELATNLKDDARVQRAKAAAFAYHRARVAAGDPGYWWKLDDILWEHDGIRLSPAEAQDLLGWLDDALGVHANMEDPKRFDPHQALDAADRLARRYQRMGNKALADAAVQLAGRAFEAAAAQAAPLTAMAWLETLLIRYRAADLMDDVARVEGIVRVRGEEAQQSMTRREVRFEIPAEEMEAWIEGLTGVSERLALARIAMNLIAKEDSLREAVENSAANTPLQALIRMSIMGPRGVTAATIGSVKDDMPGRIISAAAAQIGQAAPFLNQALERAKSKYQLNTGKILAFLAAASAFPPHVHSLLKQGVDAWFAEDTVKAVHVLVPRVEAALREILAAMGQATLKPNRDGGFDEITMGAVLGNDVFKRSFHPSSRLHLQALYTTPKGINLRNKIAHGMAGEELLGRAMANWVVHSLLLLATLGQSWPDGEAGASGAPRPEPQ